MRGLTSLERQLLSERINGPRCRPYPATAIEGKTLQNLQAQGRTFVAQTLYNQNTTTGIRRRLQTSDLGRLALRVCPVED